MRKEALRGTNEEGAAISAQRKFTPAEKGYLSVLDENLAKIVDAGRYSLHLAGTQCAAACVLGPVVVVEHSGFSVGCYTSLEFREIFRLNYFKDQTG